MHYSIYILKQTARNLRQTWGTQTMTLLTVSLSVLIFAFFFLIHTNILSAGARLGDELRLIIYLDDEVVPEMQAQLKKRINDFTEVEKIIFISRQEAYDQLAENLGRDRDVLADMDPSFLPPSIEIYPKKDLKTLTSIQSFSSYLATLPGAQKVQYGQVWVEKFGYFTNLLRIVVMLSAGLLVLSTVFMVSYTIRLTLFTRHEELELLRLLGATNAYIQTPLLIEGFLQGLLGSSLGMLALYLLFAWIKRHFSGPDFLGAFNFTFFPPTATLAILMVSIMLCSLGSLVSIRKFLRV